MTFNEQLLKVRVQLDLTKTELANKTNVSFITIFRWENRKSNPTKRVLLYCKENKIVFEEGKLYA